MFEKTPDDLGGSKNELKKGSVGTWQGAFYSLAQVGPAADIAILMIGTFKVVGFRSVTAVLVAWLIYGMWMITPYEFSKLRSNAGGYYAYSAASTKSGFLGPATAFSWLYENLTSSAFAVLGISSFLFLLSSEITALKYLWVVFAVGMIIYVTVIPYLGIRPSVQYTFITGFAEVMFLLVASIIIIVEVGPANSFMPFTLPVSVVPVFFLSMIFSISDFTGIGISTTISEEVTEPKKKIKNSLLLSYIFSGLALIPATYALTVGWGISGIGSFAGARDPGLIVFERYLGPIGGILLVIFTINSYLSNGVAKTNAVSRVWFSASRDKIIFPKSFSQVHKKYKSPHKAIRAYMILMLVINLIFGFFFGPRTGALILLTGAGIGIIFTHIYANIGLTLYTKSQKVFRFFVHGVIPITSSIIAAFVIYYTVEGDIMTQVTSPSFDNFAFATSAVIGLIWSFAFALIISYYYVKKHPHRATAAGTYDSDHIEISWDK
ncbi:MAG: APC family permease [Candidatus Thermoplasmatota archaeon]|nr:APC family permease [Candidatus Thermoplasmatota archaeon]